MAVDPWPMDPSGGSPSYTAAEARLGLMVPLIAGAGTSLGVRSGVRPSGSATDLLVAAQSSPDMTVKVNTGAVVLQGFGSTTGAYGWALDTITNLTIGASHATLDRTDRICVRLRDANIDTSGQRDCAVMVVAGTPGGGVPSLPVDAVYFELAQVSVIHAVTTITAGAITDKRVYTAATGGVIVCTSTTKPTNPAPGQIIYISNATALGGRWQYWDGAAWQYQSLPVTFASAAARTTAIPTPATGMLTYRSDLGALGNFEGYYGSAWVPAGAQRIDGTTLLAPAATITFSSIPGAYASLILKVLAAGSTAATLNIDCTIRINGDSANNYAMTTWDASQAAQNPAGAFTSANSSLIWGLAVPGASYAAGRAGGATIEWPGYSDTVLNKVSLHDMWVGDGGTSYNVHKRWGFWAGTAAITTLLLTCGGGGNFTTGSHFTLYGLP